jgi:hypothetical protein
MSVKHWGNWIAARAKTDEHCGIIGQDKSFFVVLRGSWLIRG